MSTIRYSVSKRSRGDGRRSGWWVRYRDETGKQCASRVFTTRKAALDEADRLRAQDTADRLRPEPTMADLALDDADKRMPGLTVRAMFADWLRSNPDKRPTTLTRDRESLARYFTPRLGHVLVRDVTPAHMRAAVASMVKRDLAPRTVSTHYKVAKAAFAWAVETDLIETTPCRGVRLPEVRDRHVRVVLDVAALHRLADEVPADYRPAVYLGALGLRQAEVFGLRVGAIDFTRGTLTVRETVNEVRGVEVWGKGKTASSVRTIAVPATVLAFLNEHLRERDRFDADALVVQSPRGGPVRANNFRARVWYPAVERAGLDGLTFHALRHYAIRALREAGVPLEVVSRRVGHASIRTTADVYGSLPESLDRASAAQLDGLLSSCVPDDSRVHSAASGD